ncbi:MAG: guanylate kinase [Clostridia bacterium]|nr:guanylate kinase [Clostridia bacterium]
MNKGNLFIISGPSGTGKGTVCNELIKFDDTFLSVSLTTRDRRNDETEGVTYYYRSIDEFKKRIEDNLMLEWAQYGDNFYGTPRDKVEEKLNSGVNVILEIEVQGALKVKEKMPEAVLIFLLPPSVKDLKERLINRGRETEEEIAKRISIAKGELSKAYLYDYLIINDDFDECLRSIRNIIVDRQAKINFVEELRKSI